MNNILKFNKPKSPSTNGFKTMFAIAYDLDNKKLEKYYHTPSYNNAYGDIKKFMEKRGFTSQQGSVLYGDTTVTMTKAYIAITELSREFSWLKDSVKDIRVLQLMNNDDLMPVVEMGHSMAFEQKKYNRTSEVA